MKVGTQMDPFKRAFRYVPEVGIVPLPSDDPDGVITQEELEDSTKVPPNLEPEPDDPDA